MAAGVPVTLLQRERATDRADRGWNEPEHLSHAGTLAAETNRLPQNLRKSPPVRASARG